VNLNINYIYKMIIKKLSVYWWPITVLFSNWKLESMCSGNIKRHCFSYKGYIILNGTEDGHEASM
jgi:hypothetical protein